MTEAANPTPHILIVNVFSDSGPYTELDFEDAQIVDHIEPCCRIPDSLPVFIVDKVYYISRRYSPFEPDINSHLVGIIIELKEPH